MALNTLPQKGRGGYPILTLKVKQPPARRSSLPSIEPRTDTKLTDPAQAYEAALWAERNAWDISRRASLNGALAGRGKLSPADADRLLRQGLAALDSPAREPNALARRSGGAI
jgi:hypothetical protein